jgi:hypothetical protein
MSIGRILVNDELWRISFKVASQHLYKEAEEMHELHQDYRFPFPGSNFVSLDFEAGMMTTTP